MRGLSEYLTAISRRGDAYGGGGGILDLLEWCGKPSTRAVTEEEARRFYDDPRQPYRPEEALAGAAEKKA